MIHLGIATPHRPVVADLTVLVPTLGRDLLASCLRSIALGDAWPMELVVVDQSSSPKVAGWLRELCTGSHLYI